jgi:nitronate monooxygenase
MSLAADPLSTALTRLLGIRLPLLLAPMGGAAGGRLAAAVSRAGGLGLIGVGYEGPAFIRRELDEAGDVPVGIGFIAWDLARDPTRLDLALSRRPVLVQVAFGDASPFIPTIRDAGVKVAVQVQTLRDAERAAGLGADIIIAQGTEAGGHGAARALLPLLDDILAAVAPVPVVAAGGIADGRAWRALLSLGASGVLIGTRFLAAEESQLSRPAKARLLDATGDDTVRTRVFDIVRGIDWPAPFTGRALVNDFVRRWHGRESELAAALDREGPRYAAATGARDHDTALVWAGEGVGRVRAVEPASAIVEALVREARSADEAGGSR